MMITLLELIPVVSFAYFALIMALPRGRESWIGKAAVAATSTHLTLTATVAALFLLQEKPAVESNAFILFREEHFQLFVSLLLDKISLAFLVTISLLTFMVSIYARVYLHRETGYKKFFATLTLFLVGTTVIALSNGFEMLFAGWEIVGLASFLLIAFYSHRVRPVKNAYRVFTLYRLGDVGLLLSAWLAHQIWHQNPRFSDLLNPTLWSNSAATFELTALGLLILLSAAIKSAQMPFSFWLPKAMEGPTPSSAIFYGSIAVHLGVFLLLRLSPLWNHSIVLQALIVTIGLTSALVGTGMAHVQSNIKGQLGYASVAQVGLIFVEIGFGWHDLALLHFVSHAFLRAYQILISPSVASYLIEHGNQTRAFNAWRPRYVFDRLPARLRSSLYVLVMREGFLEALFERAVWKNLKRGGRATRAIAASPKLAGAAIAAAVGAMIFGLRIPGSHVAPMVVATLALASGLVALDERANSLRAWIMTGLCQLLTLAAVLVHDEVPAEQVAVFISGVGGFWLSGAWALRRLKAESLNGFALAKNRNSKRDVLLLVSCLGVAGFPISPAFLGEDLILNHANRDSLWLAALVSASFILTGLAAMRIYARVCLGGSALAEPTQPS